MPSTPRCQEIPQGLIQMCLLMNWKSALPLSKATSTHTLSPPVSTLVSSAGELHPLRTTSGDGGNQDRADRRHEHEHREDREGDHRFPRTTTNQASNSTTATPMAAA